LLGVVCANVAVLVYARTIRRLGEIAVRSALGASRRRIIGQHVAEAFVLAAVAAAVGLGFASIVLGQVDAVLKPLGPIPFWIQVGLSFGTVANVTGLVIFASVIVGVLPALQSTGRRLQPALRQIAGGSGVRLGKTWRALIVL
jgi:ABC-type antimicrobial peptide transport system permease subunit